MNCHSKMMQHQINELTTRKKDNFCRIVSDTIRLAFSLTTPLADNLVAELTSASAVETLLALGVWQAR